MADVRITPFTYRACPECEDMLTKETACFVCGRPTVVSHRSPAIGSQHGFANAMDEETWAQVRSEIGV